MPSEQILEICEIAVQICVRSCSCEVVPTSMPEENAAVDIGPARGVRNPTR